jgi:carbamoyltransferase
LLPITQHHKNIAAGLQICFEKAYLHIIREALAEIGTKNLCLAGGCALNCVANGKIIKATDAKDFYIQPAANDAGASIGAALYASAKYDDQMQLSKRKDTTYWGPKYGSDYIRHLLEQQGLEYIVLKDPSYEGAKLLSQNKVIGWFQGRMEFGPRALGNRSILAPPNSIAIKDRINSTIKRREMFRPFAPSVLKDQVQHYFRTESDSPFMLEVCKIQESQKKSLCGIIHVDDTARIHVVTPERNRRYYDLIRHYFKFSGIPVVLNTSFNDKGEPIVCTPKNALNDFRRLPIDALIMDNYLLLKKLSGKIHPV